MRNRVFWWMGVAVLIFLLAACGSTSDEDVPDLTMAEIDPRTAEAALTITGTVEAGANLSGQIGQVPIAFEGETAWSADVILQEGLNIITVAASDKVGNTRVIRRTIFLDTQPPKLIDWIMEFTEGNETVPASTKLSLLFDEDVKIDTLATIEVIRLPENDVIPGTLSPLSEPHARVFTWEHESLLAAGTYEFSMPAGIADDLGNVTEEIEVVTFTVE